LGRELQAKVPIAERGGAGGISEVSDDGSLVPIEKGPEPPALRRVRAVAAR